MKKSFRDCEKNSKEEEKRGKFRTGILMSVAYASNIGGTGSLIGSSPQLAFKGILDEYVRIWIFHFIDKSNEFVRNSVYFQTLKEWISPLGWPSMFLECWSTSFWLGSGCSCFSSDSKSWCKFHSFTSSTKSSSQNSTTDKAAELEVKRLIRRKYKDLGPMTFHEGAVLFLFIGCVLLWFFRDPQFITGWSELLHDA